MSIDEYVDAVASHLKLHGPARQAALDDLRTALGELGASLPIDDAIATFGPASDYAALLNEERDDAEPRIRGMPNSFLPGVARRLAGTFDPADVRAVHPHGAARHARGRDLAGGAGPQHADSRRPRQGRLGCPAIRGLRRRGPARRRRRPGAAVEGCGRGADSGLIRLDQPN